MYVWNLKQNIINHKLLKHFKIKSINNFLQILKYFIFYYRQTSMSIVVKFIEREYPCAVWMVFMAGGITDYWAIILIHNIAFCWSNTV